jgi:hypothetical protein
MRSVFLAAAAALAAGPLGADSSVTVVPNGVTVVATASPVSEVLDRLARQTGMKVTYEGAIPRTLVTTRIQRATPAEAVLALLEGLGLGYALRMDASGSRVESLLMLGGSAAIPARTPAPAPVPMMPEPPVVADDGSLDEGLEPTEEPPQFPPPPTEPGQKSEVPTAVPPPPTAGYSGSPFAPQPPPVIPPSPPPQEPQKPPPEGAAKPES